MHSHSMKGAHAHPRSLDALFDARAAEYPDSPALHVDGRFVSYAALAGFKERIRATLIDEGLYDARRPIGLLCAKSPAAYAGMLAIMGSGNVYVPLNPGHPIERLRRVVEQAGISKFVVDSASFDLADAMLTGAETAGTVIVADATPSAGQPSVSPRWLRIVHPTAAAVSPSAAHGCALAYLMFTSGSTGLPKGVPVAHANVLALLSGLRPLLALKRDDRLTHFAELSFDFSIGEIFPCWDAGACLYVPSQSDLLDPSAFVRRHALTLWSSVPTLAAYVQQLSALGSEPMPTLRLSLFCGEALPTSVARFWHDAAPASRIVNLYGPTEATVFATSYTFDPDRPPQSEWVPIGEPLDTVVARIDTSAAPDGSTGELLLSGPQVVDRYWGDAIDQSRHFVADSVDERVRWYRTGDFVSRDPRHGYVFHGRADHQVKVRGFRIELQEIEATLRRLLPDQQVAVVAAAGGDEQEMQLVAFCNRLERDRDALAALCANDLPVYMVPRIFVPLAPFPVNDNGKIDYLRLKRIACATLSEGVPAAGGD
ncbi:AMP-binding protein [Burkholderia sp. MSMB175]|nr:AMP-binding protein [Burkholderia sp. MSMB175]AOK32451.1 hypothetical protein AQ611_23870 [Burkholderia sp. Bp7605]